MFVFSPPVVRVDPTALGLATSSLQNQERLALLLKKLADTATEHGNIKLEGRKETWFNLSVLG